MPRLLNRLAHDALQPATSEGYIKTVTMLGDTASACTPWLAVPILTTAASWTGFRHPPSLFSYHLSAMLNTLVHLPLTADVLLWEASISELSKKIPCAVYEFLSKQQKYFFLCQQSAALQRELSVLQGIFSNLTASSPTNNGVKSELDNNELNNLKKKI